MPGASVSGSATVRGPVRRSYIGAPVRGHDVTSIARSDGVWLTRASFSASANVAAVTSGPTGGAVPKATGAPGVDCAGVVAAGAGASRRHAARVARLSGAVIRNCRRVFT